MFYLFFSKRFTCSLSAAVFSALHKIYTLKPPLWYFPWDRAIFFDKVIEVLVIC